MLRLTNVSNGTLAVICKRSSVFGYVGGDCDLLDQVRAAWRVFLYNLPSDTIYFNWVDSWYAFLEFSEKHARDHLINRLNDDYSGSLVAIKAPDCDEVGCCTMSTSIGEVTIFDDSTVQIQSSNKRMPISVFLVDWEVVYKMTA